MTDPHNSAPRLRALIYNRVSSDPSGRKVSVESQDKENRAWCERENVEVAASITDNDRSASRVATKEREGYAEVRRALGGRVHGRIDFLVVWEPSRAQRDLADYVIMRDLCATYRVRLVYKGRIYDLSQGDDRFFTGIDALVDEREAEVIRERAERGHRNSAALGRPRGQVPYGYRREYNVVPFAQVPDPETAPIVKEIVRRLLGGDALYTIASDFNRRGIPTPQGRKELAAGIDRGRLWSSATIRVMLSSQSMTGVRTHNGQAHSEATWNPIVSSADWLEVQAVLADPLRARHHRGVEPRHLLSGIATCAVCGAWLRAATNRGKPVYQCAGLGVGHPAGKGHVSRGPRETLDAMVVHSVVDRLSDPELVEGFARASASHHDESTAIADRLADLRARLAQFEQSAVEGGITPAAFGRIEAGLLAQIEEAQSRLVGARVLPQVVLDLAGPDAAARWASIGGNVALQRQVVRALVRVVVHRSNQRRGERGFDATSIEIVDV